LNPASFYLEVLCMSAVTIYNWCMGNPFSSYGESALILVQNIVLVLLLWRYSSSRRNAAQSTVEGKEAEEEDVEEEAPKQKSALMHRVKVSVAFGASLLLMLRCPAPYLWTLPVVQLVLYVGSRLPQIYTNFCNGHTGQLSFITVFLQFAGTCARVFTTLKEVDDKLLLWGFLIGVGLNGAVLAQVLWYWKKTASITAVEEEEEEEDDNKKKKNE
jgi:mannose-P-dolichol utilization defect protein 1